MRGDVRRSDVGDRYRGSPRRRPGTSANRYIFEKKGRVRWQDDVRARPPVLMWSWVSDGGCKSGC